MQDLFLTELVIKMKPNINSVEVHPLLSNNEHPVDGASIHWMVRWWVLVHCGRSSLMSNKVPHMILTQIK
jgi:hypothetical protein